MLTRNAVTNYIAKYVTKSIRVPGVPDTRIRHRSELASLRAPALTSAGLEGIHLHDLRHTGNRSPLRRALTSAR